MKQNNNLAVGEFATLELLKNHFLNCKKIIVKSRKELDKFKNYKVKIVIDPIYFKNNIKKEDIYIVSEFAPYEMLLEKNKVHVLINNLDDEGEFGTILRTAAAFGFKNIALINSNINFFSSKVVRTSTGAIFMLNIVKYSSKKEYLNDNKASKIIEIESKNDNFLSLKVANLLYKNRLI